MRRLLRSLALAMPLAVVLALLPPPVIDTARPMRLSRLAVEGREVVVPKGFSLVGLSWPTHEADHEADHEHRTIHVRTTTGNGAHGSWEELYVLPEDGPDPGTEGDDGRTHTTPLWIGDARQLEIGDVDALPPGTRLDLVDPGTVGADPAPAAEAAPSRPGIISRKQWGANESIRKCCPDFAPVKMAFVHHTATGNNYSPSESAQVVRAIYAYHVQSNGWNDIGYNFLVDRYGRVFEGRAGGASKGVVGAHARGFNTGSTGIAVMGSFDSTAVPSAAADALRNLLAWKLDQHHVPPTGSTTMVAGGNDRFSKGQSVRLPTIAGHRDVSNTACPGERLYPLIGGLRSDARARGLPKIYTPALSHGAFTPNGDGKHDDVRLTAALDEVNAWTATLRDHRGDARVKWTGRGSSIGITWRGRTANGTALGHGNYPINIAASGNGGNATPANLSILIAKWPDASLLHGSGPAVYRIHRGRLQRFTSSQMLLTHYRWREIARIPQAAIDAYHSKGPPGFRDGSLVRTQRKTVWFISDGQRRRLGSREDFEAMFSWKAVIDVPTGDLAAHPEGQVLRSGQGRPNGSLVRGSTSAVYWIQDGTRRHVTSREVFETWFRWEEVVRIDDADLALIPPGPALGYRDGSLISARGDPAVWVVSNGERRHITSAKTFGALGYSWSNIIIVPRSDLTLHPVGDPV